MGIGTLAYSITTRCAGRRLADATASRRGGRHLRRRRPFEHADNIGGGGILETSGVQRMTVARVPSTRTQSLPNGGDAVLQLWILPDRRGLKPRSPAASTPPKIVTIVAADHSADGHRRYGRDRPSGHEHLRRSIRRGRDGGAPHRGRPRRVSVPGHGDAEVTTSVSPAAMPSTSPAPDRWAFVPMAPASY